jgi:hypothetical protein
MQDVGQNVRVVLALFTKNSLALVNDTIAGADRLVAVDAAGIGTLVRFEVALDVRRQFTMMSVFVPEFVIVDPS